MTGTERPLFTYGSRQSYHALPRMGGGLGGWGGGVVVVVKLGWRVQGGQRCLSGMDIMVCVPRGEMKMASSSKQAGIHWHSSHHQMLKVPGVGCQGTKGAPSKPGNVRGYRMWVPSPMPSCQRPPKPNPVSDGSPIWAWSGLSHTNMAIKPHLHLS